MNTRHLALRKKPAQTALLFSLLLLLFITSTGWAQLEWEPGDDHWDSRFCTSGLQGDGVTALAVSGTDLYVAGYITSWRYPSLAKWDGQRWTVLGDLYVPGWFYHGSVSAIAVSDVGEVYVGGSFTYAGHTKATNIAKWTGSSWAAVGGGVDGEVSALAVRSNEVYVAGNFGSAGGINANCLAKWDGRNWSALGTSPEDELWDTVGELAVSGTNVYAGGGFTSIGGVSANRIARWDGNSWSALGAGIGEINSWESVSVIKASGDKVYVGGGFESAGGTTATNIALWNGTNWSALGEGLPYVQAEVHTIALAGNSVYVDGNFMSVDQDGNTNFDYGVTMWNGSNWAGLGNVYGQWNTEIRALAVYGNAVYIGGYFDIVGVDWQGGVAIKHIAKYEGTNWSALGGSVNEWVNAMAVSGGDLYIAGDFTTVARQPTQGIAKYDGNAWFTIPVDLQEGWFYTLAACGSNLYAGGSFWIGAAAPIYNIAKWDGQSWSALGTGLDNDGNSSYVSVIVVSGTDIYVGGEFTTAGGVPARNIAKWDGTTWSALGSGLDFSVNAIAVEGSNLYAGGYNNMGGTNSPIAMWNGTNWSPLGSGVHGYVEAITVKNGVVYVGGNFDSAGGVAAANVARWDGNQWGSLGDGVNDEVRSLVFSGNDLYVGGWFTDPGHGVASWDGTNWHAMGGGVEASGGIGAEALAAIGPYVYVGGSFTNTGDKASKYLGCWDRSPKTFFYQSSVGGRYPLSVVVVPYYYVASDIITNFFLNFGDGTTTNISVGFLDSNLYDAYGFGFEHLYTSAGSYTVTVVASGPTGVTTNKYVNAITVTIPLPGNEQWDSTALGIGLNGVVTAIAVSGTNVYVGGQFTRAGYLSATNIARWDGSSWSALGDGVTGQVNALAVCGNDVYVGGWFTSVGGVPAKNIAKWNGSTWSALSSGTGDENFSGGVHAIAVIGTNIYVGGDFLTAGGVSARNIAKWDGSSWSALGSGVEVTNYFGNYFGTVNTLTVSANELYVGGDFITAGGVSANGIAKWNGNSWTAVGGSSNVYSYAWVKSLAVVGSNVYASGGFEFPDDWQTYSLVRWDGNSWVGLVIPGDDDGPVDVIVASGTNLYAGGEYTGVNGTSAANISKWNGSSWSALGTGIARTNGVGVKAIAVSGNMVYVGGRFVSAGEQLVGNLAIWHEPLDMPLFLITSTRREGNDINIRWITAGGKTNFVQASLQVATNYVDLSGPIAIMGNGNNSTNYLDIGAATNGSARFYRIRSAPNGQ